MKKNWLFILLAVTLMSCADDKDDSVECFSHKDCMDKYNTEKPVCNQMGICEAYSGTNKECANNNDCAAKYADKPICNEQGICVSNAQSIDKCGDGNITGAEVCEPSLAMTKACSDFDSTKNWKSGVPGCDSTTCKLTMGSCSESATASNDVCGDGRVTGSEICDPNFEVSKTCKDYNSSKEWQTGGKPGCDSNCQLTVGTCQEVQDGPVAGCGDGEIKDGEQCDPGAVFNKTCGDFDNTKEWSAGAPGCDPKTCKLTVGSCLVSGEEPDEYCGDGVVNGTEQCDPKARVMEAGCSTFNSSKHWKSGEPTCSANCILEQGTCVEELCGNGQIDTGEQCDFGLNNYGLVLKEKSCTDYSPEYQSGTATCKNSCTTLDVSNCSTQGQQTGLYYCQLMAPRIVTFSSSVTEVTLKGYVAVANQTNKTTGNDGGVEAQLIYGVEKQKLDEWANISATADSSLTHDSIDAYKANLTKAQFDALSAETVYYTFRFRQPGDTEWKYCASDETNPSVINGEIGFLTKDATSGLFNATEHNLGVANSSNVIEGNILANFTFNAYNNNDVNKDSVYSSEEGPAKIQGKNLNCGQNGCLLTGNNAGNGNAWNLMGFKSNNGTGSNQAQEVDTSGNFKNAHIVISGISTTGKRNIGLDFRYRRTNASDSPTHVLIYYSDNGGENVLLRDLSLSNEAGGEFKNTTTTFDSNIENKSSVSFILIPYGGNGGNNGAIRFDDIVISANHN